ncbi:hypothetical protein EHRUM2_04950, partial [Ehrlichia ruminantium]
DNHGKYLQVYTRYLIKVKS